MRDEGFNAEELPDDDGWPEAAVRGVREAVAIAAPVVVFLLVAGAVLAAYWTE